MKIQLRHIALPVVFAGVLMAWGGPGYKNAEQLSVTEKSIPVSTPDSTLKEGDLIFQSSSSGQGLAIQMATGSKYNHVGMLYKKNGKLMVLEAMQPIKITALESFISRGDNKHYVVKRLKENVLNDSILTLMHKEADKHVGKNYDLYFGWDDSLIYCSELVWKIYDRTLGIQVGTLQKLKDFDLSNPIVQYKLAERFGDDIPYEENVISPARIFESDKLATVLEK
ncbi:MAG TPA: YiiX family permuted papain-like enzyme [Bacteroidia bacterium]|nr:YiiX family permuted papain-like enzyme [Bacteroidia bacterium]